MAEPENRPYRLPTPMDNEMAAHFRSINRMIVPWADWLESRLPPC